MGTELHKKGACLAGAFRIPAEHSMSWNFSRPFCGGHPNEKDLAVVASGVRRIYRKILSDKADSLSPWEISFYRGKQLEKMLEGGFETSKARFPKLKFNEALCTGCGQCAEACPVECVSLSPAPIMGDACIMCYNCVKTCPEGALSADFSKSEDIIRKRIKLLKEPQITVVLPKED
jgi:ferredoxin